MTCVRALAAGLAICAAVTAAPRRASTPPITLSGRISVQGSATPPRFTVQLYPPRESNEPMMATYSDSRGNFRFANLKDGRYLLEVRTGQNTLAYQKVLVLDSRQPPAPLEITLRTR